MLLRRLGLIVVGSVLLIAGAQTAARAQAWVGPKGSLDGELDVNHAASDKDFGENGLEFKNAGVTTEQTTLHVEYVPLENLAVDVHVPFIAIKYTGTVGANLHPGGGKYDDGKYHYTLTDLALRARYAVLIDPVAIAPHLGFSIPMADYETTGNAVGGRHTKGLHAGISFGKAFLETFYAHLLYDFTYASKFEKTMNTAKYSQNASDIAFLIGDKLLDDKLDLNLAAQYHMQHDGISFNEFSKLPADVVQYHDAILKESAFLIGGGVGYSFTQRVSLAASLRLFISGKNTQNASVFGLTLTWNAL